MPTELILLIFKAASSAPCHVSDSTLDSFPYSALLVCKRWHALALRATEIWTKVGVLCHNTFDLPEILAFLKRHASRAGGHRMMEVEMSISRRAVGAWLPILTSQSRGNARWCALQLRSSCGPVLLPLISWASCRVDEEARCFSSLETLELFDEEDEKTSGFRSSAGSVLTWLPKILKYLSRLKRLHTRRISLHLEHSVELGKDLIVAPALQELCLEDCDLEALTLFQAAKMPELTTLGIQCRPCDQARSRTPLLEASIPELSKLRRAVFHGIGNREVETLLSKAPSLTDLAVSEVNSDVAPHPIFTWGRADRIATLTVSSGDAFEAWSALDTRFISLTKLTVNEKLAGNIATHLPVTLQKLRGRAEVLALPSYAMTFEAVCHRLMI